MADGLSAASAADGAPAAAVSRLVEPARQLAAGRIGGAPPPARQRHQKHILQLMEESQRRPSYRDVPSSSSVCRRPSLADASSSSGRNSFLDSPQRSSFADSAPGSAGHPRGAG